MAYSKPQFLDLIKRVLLDIHAYSPSALYLLLGTAAQESAFGTYLRQINGPALGPFQMEPTTEKSIWIDFLEYRWQLAADIWTVAEIIGPAPEKLETDLVYSIIMARCLYLWKPEPLPQIGDDPDNPIFVDEIAHYWKRHYNTAKGKGTVEQFKSSYARFVSRK